MISTTIANIITTVSEFIIYKSDVRKINDSEKE